MTRNSIKTTKVDNHLHLFPDVQFQSVSQKNNDESRSKSTKVEQSLDDFFCAQGDAKDNLSTVEVLGVRTRPSMHKKRLGVSIDRIEREKDLSTERSWMQTIQSVHIPGQKWCPELGWIPGPNDGSVMVPRDITMRKQEEDSDQIPEYHRNEVKLEAYQTHISPEHTSAQHMIHKRRSPSRKKSTKQREPHIDLHQQKVVTTPLVISDYGRVPEKHISQQLEKSPFISEFAVFDKNLPDSLNKNKERKQGESQILERPQNQSIHKVQNNDHNSNIHEKSNSLPLDENGFLVPFPDKGDILSSIDLNYEDKFHHSNWTKGKFSEAGSVPFDEAFFRKITSSLLLTSAEKCTEATSGSHYSHQKGEKTNQKQKDGLKDTNDSSHMNKEQSKANVTQKNETMKFEPKETSQLNDDHSEKSSKVNTALTPTKSDDSILSISDRLTMIEAKILKVVYDQEKKGSTYEKDSQNVEKASQTLLHKSTDSNNNDTSTRKAHFDATPYVHLIQYTRKIKDMGRKLPLTKSKRSSENGHEIDKPKSNLCTSKTKDLENKLNKDEAKKLMKLKELVDDTIVVITNTQKNISRKEQKTKLDQKELYEKDDPQHEDAAFTKKFNVETSRNDLTREEDKKEFSKISPLLPDKNIDDKSEVSSIWKSVALSDSVALMENTFGHKSKWSASTQKIQNVWNVDLNTKFPQQLYEKDDPQHEDAAFTKIFNVETSRNDLTREEDTNSDESDEESQGFLGIKNSFDNFDKIIQTKRPDNTDARNEDRFLTNGKLRSPVHKDQIKERSKSKEIERRSYASSNPNLIENFESQNYEEDEQTSLDSSYSSTEDSDRFSKPSCLRQLRELPVITKLKHAITNERRNFKSNKDGTSMKKHPRTLCGNRCFVLDEDGSQGYKGQPYNPIPFNKFPSKKSMNKSTSLDDIEWLIPSENLNGDMASGSPIDSIENAGQYVEKSINADSISTLVNMNYDDWENKFATYKETQTNKLANLAVASEKLEHMMSALSAERASMDFNAVDDAEDWTRRKYQIETMVDAISSASSTRRIRRQEYEVFLRRTLISESKTKSMGNGNESKKCDSSSEAIKSRSLIHHHEEEGMNYIAGGWTERKAKINQLLREIELSESKGNDRSHNIEQK